MSWTKVSTEGGPCARHQHAAAVLEGSLFVFGGQSKTKAYGDFWKYDITNNVWEELSTTGGPSARWGASMEAINGQLYVYGGEEVNGTLGELWVFNVAQGTWAEGPQTGQTPPPRSAHASGVCYESFLVVMDGRGASGDELSDIAFYDTSSGEWSRPFLGHVPEVSPPPRKRHSIAIHGTDLYVFAGWQGNTNNTGAYWSDMYKLDMENYVWSEVNQKGAIPEARAGHGCVVVGDHMFVWGGWGSGTKEFNELHYFEVDGCSWRKQKKGVLPPCAYNLTLLRTAPDSSQIIMFGGAHNADECTNAVWLLDVASIY